MELREHESDKKPVNSSSAISCARNLAISKFSRKLKIELKAEKEFLRIS
jgi:hypothetical protein